MPTQILPVPSSTNLQITRGDPLKFFLSQSSGSSNTYKPTTTKKKKKSALKWSEGYATEGAPDWWRGLVPSSYNSKSTYATISNAMIPFLSPEDQRTVAQNLSLNYSDKKKFGIYNPETTDYGDIPTKVTSEITSQMTSKERAQNALDSLVRLAAMSKKKKFGGTGYNLLRQVLTTMKDFGGDASNNQTRAQYSQMQSALDPLLSSLEGSEYESLAKQLTAPYFTAGKVVPISKDSDTGKYTFGAGNKGLY